MNELDNLGRDVYSILSKVNNSDLLSHEKVQKLAQDLFKSRFDTSFSILS